MFGYPEVIGATVSNTVWLDLRWQKFDYFLEAALRGAGFGEILCYPAADLGMAAAIGEGRVFFVAARL